MWIDWIALRGLGPFRSEEVFRFDRRGALISGGNESGKTTFVRAVAEILFGPNPARPGSEGYGEIAFRVGSASYHLSRDFKKGTVRLASDADAVLFEGSVGESAGADAYRVALEGLIGPFGVEMWRRSGLIEDGNLATGIDDTVKAWLLANSASVAADLERRIAVASASGGNGGEPGLAEIQNELAQRRRERDRKLESSTRLAVLAQEIEARNAERVETLAGLRRSEDDLMNLVRFEHLTQERERLENVLVELREERDRIRGHLEGEEQARAILESEYADFMNAPEDVEEGIQIWIEASQRLLALDREIERVKESMDEAPRSRTLHITILATLGMGLLAWLAALGAGSPALATLLVPLFSGAGLLLAWGLGRNADRLREAGAEEARRLTQDRADAAAMQEGARKSLGKLAEVDNPAALRRQFRGYMDLQDRLDRSRRRTPNVRPLSEVMDAYEDVLSELLVLDTETRDLVAQARYLSGMDAAPGVLAERIVRTRGEKEGVESRIQQLEREVEMRRDEVGALEVLGNEREREDEERLQADIQRLEAHEADLTARLDAMRTRIEVLRRPADEDQLLGRVAERASSLLARLTAGRYRDVRFGEDRILETHGDEGWTRVDRLSRAAADQLHFALRVALCEDADAERGLPLILDEPFRGWDDPRLEGAHEVLEGLVSQGRQCILLSADPRLRFWAWPSRQLDRNESSEALRRHAA